MHDASSLNLARLSALSLDPKCEFRCYNLYNCATVPRYEPTTWQQFAGQGCDDAIIFGYIIFSTIRDCSSKEGLVSTAPALIGCCLGISILWSLLLNKYRPEVVQKMLTRSKP